MPNYKKIFGLSIIICWAIILSYWLVSVFFPEMFIIIPENERLINLSRQVENNQILLFIFAVISSTISLIPYWLASIKAKWFKAKEDFILCIITVILSVIIKLVSLEAGFIVDLIWVFTGLPLFLGASKKNCVFLAVSTFVYQAAIIQVRGGILELLPFQNAFSQWVLNFDFVAFIYLLYLYSIKGGEYNELLVRLVSIPRQIAIRSYEAAKNARNRRHRHEISSVGRRIERELNFKRNRAYAIIFSAMLIFSYFNYLAVEVVVLFLSYLALRNSFPKTYHTTPWKCIGISIILFFFLISNTSTIHTSLVQSTLISLMISWGLWRAADYKDLLEGIEGRERDFRIRCSSCGLSSTLTEIAVGKEVHHKTIKEQMQDTGLSQSTIKNYRSQVNIALGTTKRNH